MQPRSHGAYLRTLQDATRGRGTRAKPHTNGTVSTYVSMCADGCRESPHSGLVGGLSLIYARSLDIHAVNPDN